MNPRAYFKKMDLQEKRERQMIRRFMEPSPPPKEPKPPRKTKKEREVEERMKEQDKFISFCKKADEEEEKE